jgi:S-DNA-T family DNA segregation ATPase FtsK/SpoIIIE
MVNVPTDILNVNSPCGRGVMDGQELQVAVFGGDANVAAQGRAIGQLATEMRDAGFSAPAPIERLPENLLLDELPASAAGLPSFGLASETLTPIGVVPQGVLMVTGPPGSGRSTALLTLAQAVRRTNPDMRIVYMSPTPSTTARRTVWTETAIGPSAVYDRANSLISSVEFGGGSNLMVVVESVSDFGGTEAESELARLVKTLSDASAFVVGESEVSTWNQAYLLAQPFESPRRGIVLAPDSHEVDSLLNTSIGIVRQREFPPGRGVFVEKGRGVWLQMAQPGS